MKSAVKKLANMLAPSDHAGRGNWDNNTRIPISAWAWAIVFIAGWVGFQHLAHGAGL